MWSSCLGLAKLIISYVVVGADVGKCGLFHGIFATRPDRWSLLGIEVDLYQTFDVVFGRRGGHVDVHETAAMPSSKGEPLGRPQQLLDGVRLTETQSE